MPYSMKSFLGQHAVLDEELEVVPLLLVLLAVILEDVL